MIILWVPLSAVVPLLCRNNYFWTCSPSVRLLVSTWTTSSAITPRPVETRKKGRISPTVWTRKISKFNHSLWAIKVYYIPVIMILVGSPGTTSSSASSATWNQRRGGEEKWKPPIDTLIQSTHPTTHQKENTFLMTQKDRGIKKTSFGGLCRNQVITD